MGSSVSSLHGALVKTPDGMADAFGIVVDRIRAGGPQFNRVLKCRAKGD